jgi:hypothetical protein
LQGQHAFDCVGCRIADPARNRLIVEALHVLQGEFARWNVSAGSRPWQTVPLIDAEGEIADVVALENRASNGKSGRMIPMHLDLRAALAKLRGARRKGAR